MQAQHCPVKYNASSMRRGACSVQTCDAEHDAPERLPAALLIAQEKGEPVVGPKRLEDGRAEHDDVVEAHDRVERKPDHDDRREECAHKFGAKLLDHEERRQDDNGNNDDNGCR